MATGHLQTSRIHRLFTKCCRPIQAGGCEQLAADLRTFHSDVTIITETHFKKKHSNSVVGIDDYTLYRRDRVGRRGGGVAMYVRTNIQSAEWVSQFDNRTYELLWVHVNGIFITRQCRRTTETTFSTTVCGGDNSPSPGGDHCTGWRSEQATRPRYCGADGSGTGCSPADKR